MLYGLHDLVGVFGVQADRECVYVGEFLEEHRFALHDRHRGPRPDVAETEHRRPVAHHRDRVALDGKVEGPLRVLVYRPADTRHTRRIRHREVVAGPERHLGVDLDLASQMHQKRPVGDVHDLDVRQVVHDLDYLLAVLRVAGVDGNVADGRLLLHPYDVHRAYHAAGVPDGREYLSEGPRRVRELDPQRHAVTSARYGFHNFLFHLGSSPRTHLEHSIAADASGKQGETRYTGR